VKSVSVKRRLFVLAAAAVALAVGAPPGYWTQMATSLSPKEDYNYNAIDGRKAVVARGIGYMKQYPRSVLGLITSRGPNVLSLLRSPRCVLTVLCAAHRRTTPSGGRIGLPLQVMCRAGVQNRAFGAIT
jgi:hypothetical protein